MQQDVIATMVSTLYALLYGDGTKLTYIYKGYGGKDCSEDSTETINYSPALLGLIITLFIIVSLLGVSIAFMIRQMNAYKEDLAHYHVLKGSDEDSAAV